MIFHFAVSLGLLGLSGLLIDQHRRVRDRVRADRQLDDRGRRFATAQYRRRMIASSTIGFVGALIAIEPIIPRRPGPYAAYVALLLVGCTTLLVLGVLDALAASRFYRRVQLEERLKQSALAMELQRQTKNKPTEDR